LPPPEADEKKLSQPLDLPSTEGKQRREKALYPRTDPEGEKKIKIDCLLCFFFCR
jgi:Pyruvate/2-oxoacid:ferredoxin oxidoreductase delta subunit